jgi:hypothetical protein
MSFRKISQKLQTFRINSFREERSADVVVTEPERTGILAGRKLIFLEWFS